MNEKKSRHGVVIALLCVLIGICAILIAIFWDPLLTLVGTLRSHPKTIACLGDSITYGAGVKENREAEAWTFVLNDLLGESYTVLNYGQNGATLQAEGDRPYQDTGFLQEAMAERAGTYILMLGANDSKEMNWDRERYAAELEELIQTLCSGHWKHRVILMQLPKAFPDEETGQIRAGLRDDVIREEINPIIRELADKYHLTCVDLYALTEDHPEWYSDGIHPNREGNRQIAELLAEVLQG